MTEKFIFSQAVQAIATNQPQDFLYFDNKAVVRIIFPGVSTRCDIGWWPAGQQGTREVVVMSILSESIVSESGMESRQKKFRVLKSVDSLQETSAGRILYVTQVWNADEVAVVSCWGIVVLRDVLLYLQTGAYMLCSRKSNSEFRSS